MSIRTFIFICWHLLVFPIFCGNLFLAAVTGVSVAALL